eukprot:12687707-Alexandrium_andersonii.AAC.1
MASPPMECLLRGPAKVTAASRSPWPLPGASVAHIGVPRLPGAALAPREHPERPHCARASAALWLEHVEPPIGFIQCPGNGDCALPVRALWRRSGLGPAGRSLLRRVVNDATHDA